MRVVRLRLSVRGPFPCGEIKEEVYARSDPEDMLEHLYVETCAGWAELVFFLHEDIRGSAEVAVLRLWRRVTSRDPSWRTWSVLEVGSIRDIDPGKA
ncbi:hypothetical protein ACFWZ7_23240 [Nocardiopsis alba]|uniref:Uncharacterized protein n=1 Tax=Nocardiopsis alba (strain ATCC BAA-2165 / BE74) TaxID=1205910 RepID=J7L9Z2_NOCAA|nr:hypothetical protein [Nocardiopsis alba]AFR07302.1 hypothetical protein B005_4306 [Nocardiopsis alba ATCC BAA-2165]